MIEIEATVLWSRGSEEAFTDNRYSRVHSWRFDGGLEVPASASPHIVPLPYSSAANVDPEEAYVAALSSCHMLTFLSIAAKQGLVVDRYVDLASGVMTKNAEDKLVVSKVTLRPVVSYRSRVPTLAEDEALHHAAHEQCFLANSVLTEIDVVPTSELAEE
ncbi:OsmC family protein [Herbaspirillum sp. RV1423]|uniref:OsmC family protein n=1 Tax=Herbaspirillum sp. RV1423 TaxID=1443993 RepID=UPI0004B736EA|nr:OsmC family protein [Herbaspirillum sp. RV1423]